MDVHNFLSYILLGAVLGIIGQGLRIIIGLKKQNDAASSAGKKLTDVFDFKQMMISLVISCIVGAAAGSLGMLQFYQAGITKELIISLIMIGYAGTDFIEGFINTNSRKTT